LRRRRKKRALNPVAVRIIVPGSGTVLGVIEETVSSFSRENQVEPPEAKLTLTIPEVWARLMPVNLAPTLS
jgi:hypothetical protein